MTTEPPDLTDEEISKLDKMLRSEEPVTFDGQDVAHIVFALYSLTSASFASITAAYAALSGDRQKALDALNGAQKWAGHGHSRLTLLVRDLIKDFDDES